MPRYFFHIRKHERLQEDPEGAELSSPEAAIEEAIEAARDLLADKVRSGDVVDGDEFEIRDENDQVVHVLPFRSVLRLKE